MYVRNVISIILATLMAVLVFTSCTKDIKSDNNSQPKGEYMQITPDEAKQIMDIQKDYIILDVRTKEEYDTGHIPNAMLIPDYEITTRAKKELKDKDQLILVYCRSGNRSKSAAQNLVSMGYTNVREFGGIIDWKYDIEK